MGISRRFYSPIVLLAFILSVLVMAAPSYAQRGGGGWPLIPPEDLAMKECPGSPGAPAVILLREVHGTDMEGMESNYVRIKILTDAGKEYANVEIPYGRDEATIDGIKARTVQPDGTSVEFDGKVYDKTIVKFKRWKTKAKTFAISNAQVGSIIEYKYSMHWNKQFVYDNHWDVQRELFTRQAKFSLVPYDRYTVFYTWALPPFYPQPETIPGKLIALEVRDVPGFKDEEYMPPEDTLKSRVDFFYLVNDSPKEPKSYWKDRAKALGKEADGFIGKQAEVRQAAAEIIGPNDTPEAKLRKLYARAQKIRNLSFERTRTEKEEKKEGLKDNMNVADVLKHSYGTGYDINMLFVALARAAGFEAWPVRGASRHDHVFDINRLTTRQLDCGLVEVRVGTKSVYLDPATAFCPYGLLPWEESDVQGIRLHREAELNDLNSSAGGPSVDGKGKPGVFMTTSKLTSSDATIERQAELQLDGEGAVQGKILVKYVGQEALTRRLENRDENEAGRRKELEDEVKEWLPASATVELKNTPNWDQADEPLSAEFSVKIAGLGARAGHRLLLPLAIFEASKKYPFQTLKREHPVDLHYPSRVIDAVTLQLPADLHVENLPAPRRNILSFGLYESSYSNSGGALRFQRTMAQDGTNFSMLDYPSLRAFYNSARVGDEAQAVLKAEQGSPTN